jgi:hypothetical protein
VVAVARSPSSTFRATAAALAAVALSSVLSCGGGEEAGLCPAPAVDSPVALFNLFTPNAEELAPFPTDLKTVASAQTSTGLEVRYERTAFAEALSSLDGFGLYGGMLVPVTRPLDLSSLPVDPAASTAAGASVFLLDLEGLDEEGEESLEEMKIPVEITAVADDIALLLYGTTENAIGIRPLRPLKPVSRYGLVVTTCVRGADGLPLAPDPKFRDALAGKDTPTQNPAALEELAVLSSLLHRHGYAKNDLALLATFTTQSIETDMVAARNEINHYVAVPQPSVTDVYDATDAEGNLNPALLARMPEVAEELADLPLELYRFGRMGKVVFGTFSAASFLHEDGLIHHSPISTFMEPAGEESLEFILVLPKEDAAAGIVPPYRVLVYQHAMGVCKETVLALGDTLARFGIAAIGIDAVSHGSRSEAGPGTCTIEPMEFFDMENFTVTADRFRQTALDIMSLVRMLREGEAIDVLPDPGGDGAPDLDVSRLAFAGQSMGASVGVPLLAFEDAFGAAALNVAGGALSTLLLHSTHGEPCTPLPFSDYNLHGLSIAAGLQTAADRADPVNFAPYLIREPADRFDGPVSVLYQQAVCDASVPVESYGLLAELMGLPLAGPVGWDYPSLEKIPTPAEGNLEGGVTGGLFQFGPPAPHEVLLKCDEACIDTMFAVQLQLAIFLKTYYDGGPGVIVDPFDPSQTAPYE